MEIEDMGELRKFESVPSETILYMTAVCYNGSYWTGGPYGLNKEEVIRNLSLWTGITKARIYAVKVPVDALPAA